MVNNDNFRHGNGRIIQSSDQRMIANNTYKKVQNNSA